MNPSLPHFVALHLLALACSAAVLGLCLFFRGLRFFVRAPFAAGSLEPVASAAEPGHAAIHGTATGIRTLSAPLTGTECYVYRTSVWQRESNKNNQWKNVAEETGHVTFLIEGATGTVSVEPLGADLDLRKYFTREYGAPSSGETAIPERLAAFLARNGLALDRETRVEESWLEPATQVFVTGTLTENRGNTSAETKEGATGTAQRELSPQTKDTGTPALPPEIIRLSSGPLPTTTTQMSQQSKIAAALSRAGMAQTDIWASRETSASSVSSIAVAERPQPDPGSALQTSAGPVNLPAGPLQSDPPSALPRLTFIKGANDPSFVISNHSEPEYPMLDYKSVALVIVGSGLTVLGLFILMLGHHLPWVR
ncbi:MAG: GIDE domain-containing protein [Terriglobales bacterium]